MDRRRAADGEGRTQRGRHRRGRRGVVQPADDDRRLGLGSRQQLERRFEDQAERAVRAAIDFDQVEPGDVLHYATAREDDLGAPVHQAQADQAVADRARADPPRSGERRRHEAADGRFPGGPIERARIHRLERQDLIVRGERGFDRRERSSRSRAQHHFGRFVKHDPLQSRRRKRALRLRADGPGPHAIRRPRCRARRVHVRARFPPPRLRRRERARRGSRGAALRVGPSLVRWKGTALAADPFLARQLPHHTVTGRGAIPRTPNTRR